MSAISGRIEAVAVPLPEADIDTGTIFPSRFLRRARRGGYQDILFHDRRKDRAGRPDPGFPLNNPTYAGARILVTGANFGCGSSREAAVFALADAGFRCVIAPSFGEIFRANCLCNSLLPIPLKQAEAAVLIDQLQKRPGAHVKVDLQRQTVTAPFSDTFSFAIRTSEKMRLMSGQDDCALAAGNLDTIATFERAHLSRYPWVKARTDGA